MHFINWIPPKEKFLFTDSINKNFMWILAFYVKSLKNLSNNTTGNIFITVRYTKIMKNRKVIHKNTNLYTEKINKYYMEITRLCLSIYNTEVKRLVIA